MQNDMQWIDKVLNVDPWIYVLVTNVQRSAIPTYKSLSEVFKEARCHHVMTIERLEDIPVDAVFSALLAYG